MSISLLEKSISLSYKHVTKIEFTKNNQYHAYSCGCFAL